MRHHTVADVMTTDIITVTPQTSFKDLARLFVERQIGALPVLARDGTVTGIVRETDLLKKAELQRDLGTGQPLRWRRGLHATAVATIAGEVMTTRVVPVSPGTTLGDAAWLMDKHHVPCLPVVTGDGTLAGVVTPRDLLRVFLRPDEDIRREIVDDVLPAFLGVEAGPGARERPGRHGHRDRRGRTEKRDRARAAAGPGRGRGGRREGRPDLHGGRLRPARRRAPPSILAPQRLAAPPVPPGSATG